MEKNIGKMKKQRIYWYGLLLLLEIILWSFFFGYLKDKIPQYATHVGDNVSYQVIHDFTDDYVLKQKFTSPRNFDFITLNLADHDTYIQGRMKFLVYDVEGNLLLEKEVINSQLQYGPIWKEVKLSFEEVGGGKAQNVYELEILAEETTDIAMGLFGYDEDNPEKAAIVNGEKEKYSVSIGIHSYTKVFEGQAIILMLICMMGSIITVWICTKETITDEKGFLALVIPFGLCMFLLLAVNGLYDADAHIDAVYHYSNVVLQTADDDDSRNIYMRSEDAKIGEEKTGVANEQAQEFWRVLQDWRWFASGAGEGEVVNAIPASGATLLSYLPNVIGIVLGRVLNLGAYPMFYLSKILGFVAYVFVCFIAIKKTPILKTVFAFTAALPICVYHAAGITYDTIALSSSLLMCAYIFVWWERNLLTQEWILLGITVLFVGGSKGGVYLPLILLMFLVPFKRWKFTKKHIFCLSGFGVLGVTLFLIKYGSILKISMQSNEMVSNAAVKYGAGYCFRYPIEFIKMFMETLFIRSDAYLGHILGDRTSWTQEHVGWVVIIPFLMLLLAAGIRKNTEPEFTDLKKKIYIILLLVAEFVGMHIVLMSDTRTTESYIYGVQGRYFLPLVPLVVLVLRELELVRKDGKENKLYIYYSMMQAVYIMSLMDKYF